MNGAPNETRTGGRWPYSWCLVECCRQDLFNIARSILVQLPSSFFSGRLVSAQVVHPFSSIDTTAAWKKLRFILSDRSDFHMNYIYIYIYICVYVCVYVCVCVCVIFDLRKSILLFNHSRQLFQRLCSIWCQSYPCWGNVSWLPQFRVSQKLSFK